MGGRAVTVAHDLLRHVEAVGGLAEARGGKLRLTAPRPLPDRLIDELRQHKAEVLAELLAPCETADGLARLGTMPPPADVERLASDAVVARWLNEHPPAHADQDQCAACSGRLLDDLLPLAERDVHGQTVWVHASSGCWLEYVSKRRAEAEAVVHR